VLFFDGLLKMVLSAAKNDMLLGLSNIYSIEANSANLRSRLQFFFLLSQLLFQ
jgi:hypothetical protein